jgi:guanylate kinase
MPSFYGRAIIFSAPSGSGKTTLVHHLLSSNTDLSFSISVTTREKRNNEVDGRDYYFITPAEFRQKLQENAFIEWQEVYRDRFYGTLKTEIERIWADKKNVIFDVDVKGGINLKNYFGDRALAIFVRPPSLQVLKQRLQFRNTDSSESIKQRLEKAEYELKFENLFDVSVINDDLEQSKREIQRLYNDFAK